MFLGVVSDTHGHVHNTLDAVRMLDSLGVEQVLHCGDIGTVHIPPLFRSWPTHFVFGNVDDDRDALRAAIVESGLTCHGTFGSLEIAGRRIAFLHSDDRDLFERTIASGEWDLVCYGHTHKAEQHLAGRTLVLNPGALYRARPHSLAVVELPSLHVEIIRLP